MFASSSETSSSMGVTIETLATELRQTERALAHWRSHASRLHEQLRALKKLPNDVLGAPKSVLPLAAASAGLAGAGSLGPGSLVSYSSVRPRERENSVMSTTSSLSLMSQSTYRSRRANHNGMLGNGSSNLLQGSGSVAAPNMFTREFWDPKAAEMQQRRDAMVTVLQRLWRGVLQRRRYRAARAFFAIVNGSIELKSGWRSVPAYTLTVVRAGACWQVSHRFSDWLELHKQLTMRMPDGGAVLPALPARMPFNSTRIVAYRQFALNRYLQELFPLVEEVPKARRCLLSFVSRSHMHWLYALVERQQSLFLALSENQHRPVAPEDIHMMRGFNNSTIYEGDGEVHDASSGQTRQTAALGG